MLKILACLTPIDDLSVRKSWLAVLIGWKLENSQNVNLTKAQRVGNIPEYDSVSVSNHILLQKEQEKGGLGIF